MLPVLPSIDFGAACVLPVQPKRSHRRELFSPEKQLHHTHRKRCRYLHHSVRYSCTHRCVSPKPRLNPGTEDTWGPRANNGRACLLVDVTNLTPDAHARKRNMRTRACTLALVYNPSCVSIHQEVDFGMRTSIAIDRLGLAAPEEAPRIGGDDRALVAVTERFTGGSPCDETQGRQGDNNTAWAVVSYWSLIGNMSYYGRCSHD